MKYILAAMSFENIYERVLYPEYPERGEGLCHMREALLFHGERAENGEKGTMPTLDLDNILVIFSC